MHEVASVAAETLIAPVAGQRHRDMLACELTDAVGGNGGAIRVGLVVQTCQLVDEIEVLALDPLDEVPRVVAVRDLLRIAGLVELRIVEGDRTGIDGLGGYSRHGGDHGARIHSAGEKRAQRHLGDHAQLHRFRKPPLKLAAGVRKSDAARLGELYIPVLTRLGHRLTTAYEKRVPGGKLAY